MIIFLYGEDSYRRLKKKNLILDEYRRKQSQLNLGEFSGVDWFAEAENFLRGSSLFGGSKLAIINDPDFKILKKEAGARFRSWLKSLLTDQERVALFSVETAVAAPTLLLKEPAIIEKFDRLTGQKLEQFVKNEAAVRGLEISGAEIKQIVAALGADSWAIATELDQFALRGESRPTSRRPDLNYFNLANILKSGYSVGEKIAALELLLTVLAEEPARIFNGLSYGRYFPISPGEWYQKLADYDVLIKFGKLDYTEALLDLTLS
jgi:DNA polymerase III delta subunit